MVIVTCLLGSSFLLLLLFCAAESRAHIIPHTLAPHRSLSHIFDIHAHRPRNSAFWWAAEDKEMVANMTNTTVARIP